MLGAHVGETLLVEHASRTLVAVEVRCMNAGKTQLVEASLDHRACGLGRITAPPEGFTNPIAQFQLAITKRHVRRVARVEARAADELARFAQHDGIDFGRRKNRCDDFGAFVHVCVR